MTSAQELNNLIEKARAAGAIVNVAYDIAAKLEGRDIIETVQVIGLRGCGPHPMSPISAAERLRGLV